MKMHQNFALWFCVGATMARMDGLAFGAFWAIVFGLAIYEHSQEQTEETK